MWLGAAMVGLGLVLAACSSAEGPLLHTVADGSVMGGPSGVIAQDMPWQYQLVGEVDLAIDAELFVVDLFETPQATIDALHAQGKVAIGYLSAGTFEPWRDDASEFPDAAVGQALLAYPDESWLDIRSDAVRTLMAQRLDYARDASFEGVLPTNLTGYLTDTGFELTAADQLDYGTWLADQAHTRGLRIGMSGDFGHLAQLGPRFDWAVQYGCIANQSCGRLDAFAVEGKPVFDVELSGDPAEVCALAADYGVNAILKQPDYGPFRVGCL